MTCPIGKEECEYPCEYMKEMLCDYPYMGAEKVDGEYYKEIIQKSEAK